MLSESSDCYVDPLQAVRLQIGMERDDGSEEFAVNCTRKTVRSVAKLSIPAILALGLLLGVSPKVLAWGNGGYSSDPSNPDYGIHDWIADKALDMQVLDVAFLRTTYHAEYLYGTEWPDNSSNFGDTYNHHVYYFKTRAVQENDSAIRAEAMYSQALAYLRCSDLRNAALYIGAMTHYIADVGVFGHTMGAGTDWGAEVHHTSDYEPWFNSHIGSFATPTGISLFDSSAYDATMGLAYTITFGLDPIKNNTWMDAHYGWLDPVFKSSALASLNESVEAVAGALNHLLTEAALAIPEFGSLISVMLVTIGVMAMVMALTARKRP